VIVLKEPEPSALSLGRLSPLECKDLPEPISTKKILMSGPSIIILAMGLGSGEFIMFPTLTLKYGFVILWAAWLGFLTQYIVNTEIERYTLATGETVLTGFSRIWKPWAWIFLVCNILPWMWPGWAMGGAQCFSFFLDVNAIWLAIGGLILVGLVLSLCPFIYWITKRAQSTLILHSTYKTIKGIQLVLILLAIIVMLIITIFVFQADTFLDMLAGSVHVGYIPEDIDFSLFLTAIVFAGAGGTLNLAQSEYIRESGYGLCKYVRRSTSGLTGEEEPVPSTGFFFRCSKENLMKWKNWWRSVRIEHLCVFFITGIIGVFLLSFIAYSTLYGSEVGSGMTFVAKMGDTLGARYGPIVRILFFLMGAAILFTSELGILDATCRISADILKTNTKIPFSKTVCYLGFLWLEILLGIGILVSGIHEPVLLLKIAGSLSGIVMVLYSAILLYSNSGRLLGKPISIRGFAFVGMCWAVGFYGYFSLALIKDIIQEIMTTC